MYQGYKGWLYYQVKDGLQKVPTSFLKFSGSCPCTNVLTDLFRALTEDRTKRILTTRKKFEKLRVGEWFLFRSLSLTQFKKTWSTPLFFQNRRNKKREVRELTWEMPASSHVCREHARVTVYSWIPAKNTIPRTCLTDRLVHAESNT